MPVTTREPEGWLPARSIAHALSEFWRWMTGCGRRFWSRKPASPVCWPMRLRHDGTCADFANLMDNMSLSMEPYTMRPEAAMIRNHEHSLTASGRKMA